MRTGLSTEEAWSGHDRGLVLCWEKGRLRAASDSDLALSAKQGTLPELVWQRGSVYYLAYWQGLRGEDLAVDPGGVVEVTCEASKRTYAFGPRDRVARLQAQLDREFAKRNANA